MTSSDFSVRSKNAGPFWLTIDIFFDNEESYTRYLKAPVLTVPEIAALMHSASDEIKLFPLPKLHVLKISLPRPVIQGSVSDRDMHGAQWAWLLDRELKNWNRMNDAALGD